MQKYQNYLVKYKSVFTNYLKEGFSAAPKAREYNVYGEDSPETEFYIFQAVAPKNVGLLFAGAAKSLGLTFDAVFDREQSELAMLETVVPADALDELMHLARKMRFARLKFRANAGNAT